MLYTNDECRRETVNVTCGTLKLCISGVVLGALVTNSIFIARDSCAVLTYDDSRSDESSLNVNTATLRNWAFAGKNLLVAIFRVIPFCNNFLFSVIESYHR